MSSPKSQRARTRAKFVGSKFALALRALLDETGYFSRDDWSSVLGVSEAAISQWVTDRTLPRADLLRQILDILRHVESVPRGLLTRFDEVAGRSAVEVSPLGQRMMPSVAEYMSRSNLASLGRELRKLPIAQQRATLEEGSWRDTPSTDPIRHAGTIYDASGALIEELRANAEMSRDEGFVTVPVLFMHGHGAGATRHERIDLNHVLAEPRLTIVGSPGSGKSNLLQVLNVEFFEQNRSRPTFFRVSDVKPAESVMFLTNCCRSTVEQRNPVLLIDGLDEVEIGQRAIFARAVADAARQFESLQMVVTTRPIPELSMLEDFKQVGLAPLTDVQMLASFEHHLGRARRYLMAGDLDLFVSHLSERRELRERAGNPLFLRIAAALFDRNSITPFSETELIGEYFKCLLDGWERRKRIVRARRPWASSNRLRSDLAVLCFHLIVEQKSEFKLAEARQWLARCEDAEETPQVLSLLSIMSGVFRQTQEDTWQVLLDYFVRYFAALHIVEASADAAEYFQKLTQDDAAADVFRFACGMTSDAAPLLRYIARDQSQSEARRASLLFEALAQPILANPSDLNAAYQSAFTWLNRACERWRVVSSPTMRTSQSLLWEFCATGASPDRENERYIVRALKALHRARSGSARKFLIERMSHGCSVVVELSTAMEIEGRLELEITTDEEAGSIRGRIGAPQLS